MMKLECWYNFYGMRIWNVTIPTLCKQNITIVVSFEERMRKYTQKVFAHYKFCKTSIKQKEDIFYKLFIRWLDLNESLNVNICINLTIWVNKRENENDRS